MKEQIRRSVLETNSSSTHCLCMCSGTDFDRWRSGEVLYWKCQNTFGTREEIIEMIKRKTFRDGSPWYSNTDWNDERDVENVLFDEEVVSYDEFFECEYDEFFEDSYTTANGDEVVAFGYYGWC